MVNADSPAPADLVERVLALPRRWHGHGTMPPAVLEAIARLLSSEPPQHSAETGTGQTTLLFSHLSGDHVVFTVDDTGDTDSLGRVRSSPLFSPDRVSFVLGPTQQTLASHSFGQPLQFVLLDGPHAYPFPELEYYHLYPHLEIGGLLVVDDIHIPTVRHLFRFLKDDDMFTLEMVVKHTAFFRRTGAPMFDPQSGQWRNQRYNERRFPQPYLLSERLKARVPGAVKRLLATRSGR